MAERRDENMRQLLRTLFDRAVAAAQPAQCVPPHLPPVPDKGRLIVVGAGKAAAAMALAVEAHYDGLGALDRLEGFVTTRHGYGLQTRRLGVREAGHPVPDAAGEQASRDTLALAKTATRGDIVLVLMSGGASALWSAPTAKVTLADKQALTRQLLRAGARIDEMNCVRKHLSLIKGGRLAMAATSGGARIITCAISDVPRDDPATIGSGPTVADPTTLADARTILARYDITPPTAIAEALANPGNETPKPGETRLAESEFRLVAAPAQSLEAAARLLRDQGFAVELLGDSLEGEASDVAKEHAALASHAHASGARVAFLSGGELTVTIRGSGRGGPNQEYALALTEALQGNPGIWAVAGDTDGTDGGTGAPDDPAGAMVFPDTLERASESHLDPARMLSDNDSTSFFRSLGDLVETGPTQTNVNDFRAILVEGTAS
ncbi:MAG: glycerate kinase [Hyphomicrobiaceae bacterium]|nr:glycerate kinase [Hyphomicrobiaceae bacterium]